MMKMENGNFIISNLDWIWLTMLACKISATAQRQNGTDFCGHIDMQALEKPFTHDIGSYLSRLIFSVF